jgi:16S rRNA (guanine1207-N2)-methyltransferase
MHTFQITDLPAHEAITETFLDGEIAVTSHSGLHLTESLLINSLSRFSAPPGSLLVAGNRTGAIAMAAAARFPNCAITCHAFDLHHARAILRNLAANRYGFAFSHDPFVTTAGTQVKCAEKSSSPQFAVACTAAIPQKSYAAACFMATPGTMTGELILDQLEDLHEALADGGTCLMACEADSGPLFKQIKALFGNISIHFDKNGISCATAKKKGPLVRRRDFSASFPASLPGGETYALTSLPGVFSHRRPDAGGLALAEIAARELRPNLRVLDMGCGCGLVGILLAKSQPNVRVTFVDSHARAMAATHRNLTALGIEKAQLVLSDEGLAKSGFHLVVGNPPYYSDFRIAELFMNTALATLRPGGTCLMVAKAARALEERQAEIFGNAEILPRRGYGVVKSFRHVSAGPAAGRPAESEE